MTRFNVLMERGFTGCMIVGQTRDQMRNRMVVLYALPGNFTEVGIHDGIDSWIASASQNPFGLDSAARLAEIADGKWFEVETGQTKRRYADGTYLGTQAPRDRRRIAPPLPDMAPVMRRRIVAQPEVKERHRVRP
jgi:hypothetical protein